MSDQIENTPEARWRDLKENGMKLSVNVESNDLIANKPAWLDEERWKKAKEAIDKYFIGVCYSSFTGLLLILQLPDGLEPLLSTGNSKDVPSLYKRYLNTILHVNSWYDDDIFNPETKGFKSIRQVRAMHKRVQSIMNDKFNVKDMHKNDRIWFNQYDVAMTQFAFIGLGMLFPQKSAMILATETELESINYYWRVLGYLMGIDDRFNCCHFDKYEDIKEFNRLIFEHEYIENFKKDSCQVGLEMTQSICLALHYFMPLVTFNNLAHWWNDCFEFNGYKPQPMNVREKMLDYWTRVSFNYLLKNESFLKFSTKLHRKRFEQRLVNKDKVYEKLREQYKDNEKLTYYSDRVDYFDKNNSKKVEPLIEADTLAALQVVADKTIEDDNNNNNTSEDKIYNKAAAGCPFGYVSKMANQQQQQEQVVKQEVEVSA